MTRLLIILLILSTITSGCKNGGDTYKLMERADSLVAKEQEDSALYMLASIDTTALKYAKDKAYYNLLRTCARYRRRYPISSTRNIDYSVDYYRKSNDARKLARALYYKGMVAYELGDTETAITCLKEAEHIEDKSENSDILNYIYINLANINLHTSNYNTALQYAKISLETAKRRKDKSIVCLSLDKISAIFSSKEQHDSALFYTIKAIPYIKYLTKEEKVSALANIAASYFNQGHMDKAEHYIRQSLAIEPTAHAYYILGSIYLEQGKGTEAEALWSKAINTGPPEVKAEAMLWMADLKKEAGEYRESTELMAKAEALSDSISRAKKTEDMLRLQAAMEHAEAKRKAEGRLTAAVVTLIAVAITLASLAVYLRRKANMTKRKLSEIQELTGKYEQEISRLSQSKAENEKKIKSLNRKMETLREKRAAIIGHGRKRYEEIADGGTIAMWRKNDFEAAIEYCRTVNPEAVNNIENSHKRLTPYNTFFLLLPYIGITDDNIQRVMNMSAGAVRTMKYRLKGKDTEQ